MSPEKKRKKNVVLVPRDKVAVEVESSESSSESESSKSACPVAEPIISISDGDPDGDVKSTCVASDITAVGEVKNDSSDSDVEL